MDQVEETASAAQGEPALDAIIEKYITLRDQKAAIEAKAKADKAAIDTMLERCEVFLLNKMREMGLDGLRSPAGTVFKKHKVTIGVADWGAVLPFIIEHGLWTMLEKRVSKTAVEEFVEAHKDLPPGLNRREEIEVQIRRS